MSETNTGPDTPSGLPTVSALRALSVFSADQAGAYREHFAELASVLGADVETKLGIFVRMWATDGEADTVVLTGNAGTGKTAVAEVYCQTVGGSLPEEDDLLEVAPGYQLVKDLSGLPNPSVRAEALRRTLSGNDKKTLVCANEGVLRDALDEIGNAAITESLEKALRHGAARANSVTIVNLNRQRPTGDKIWSQLVDYVAREELWSGCDDCPYNSGGCPMRSNAEQMRKEMVSEQIRNLFRLGAGEAVPTFREVLAVLSWAIVGDDSCERVKNRNRDLGQEAFTASSGYFTRIVGGGLGVDAVDRSPLLAGIRQSGLGEVSDLEADGWLRDTSGAPYEVQVLAGMPTTKPKYSGPPAGKRSTALVGSYSPLDRVRTKQGPMTFHALGEMVSTDEDPTRVEDGLDALVGGDGATNSPGQILWRQRLYFEAPEQLGGAEAAARRLLEYQYMPELGRLAQKAARNSDTVIELNEIVCGLNFLVTGFSSPNEGLIVPDPACLFSRDPGSFRPARPSLVHGQIDLKCLTITVPDRGLVEELLDVDHVDVELVVDADPLRSLRVGPRMYQAIREAAEFQGPVGQGVAEMNDLRGFYGRLATGVSPDRSLRVADPDSRPPSLVKITLPHFARRRTN